MDSKQSERGIALLRIVFGFWLLQSSLSHLVWKPWPAADGEHVQAITLQLAEISLGHPTGWVRWIVQEYLLPQVQWYVPGVLGVELIAGLSLTFGLLTVPGALLALLLAVGTGILTHYQGQTQLAYHLVLGFAALVFIASRAGRRWGLDALLKGIRERSLLW